MPRGYGWHGGFCTPVATAAVVARGLGEATLRRLTAKRDDGS